MKIFFGLDFLPPQEVSEAILEIMEIAPNDEKVNIFSDYVIENYIDENCALFPPEIWAGKPSEVPKTTNGCEAFHKHLNAQFYKESPTIFIFLNILKEIQGETYLKIASSQKRKATKRKNEREKEARVAKRHLASI